MTQDGSVRKQRFQEAREAGRLWAKDQLGDPVDETRVSDIHDMQDSAIAAFIAIKTGRLPSLVFTSMSDHEVDVDYGSGFAEGAAAVLEAVGEVHN